MPPSAGACQTTDAALNPDCGRAGDRSSIITAIGWRRATCGVTSRPVSGSRTRATDGVGVRVGAREPLGPAEGLVAGTADGPMAGVEGCGGGGGRRVEARGAEWAGGYEAGRGAAAGTSREL